jgi:pre-mRNA-splicing factor 38A
MANTTQRGALSIHGKNPQFLVEKVIRSRIWDSLYWKEHCFALNAVTIIDRAASLQYVGGTFGGHNQPTEFICLVLKLLQLQPSKEIILEYLRAEDFKWVWADARCHLEACRARPG